MGKAFEKGRWAAAKRQAAYEMYNAFPPDNCPYQKGTWEEQEYDRGWKKQMEIFKRVEMRQGEKKNGNL